jgi:hypothetical protein
VGIVCDSVKEKKKKKKKRNRLKESKNVRVGRDEAALLNTKARQRK